MSRWHILIQNTDNTIVGQFDVGSERRRQYIHDNLPSGLSVRNEREIPEGANLINSLQTLSENVVEWDDRLTDL